jgi:hypothetical protein
MKRTSANEDLAVSFKHYKGRFLISKPPQGRKGDHTVRADDYESLKPMSHTWQSE